MTVDQHELYVSRSEAQEMPAEGAWRRLVRRIAPQDVIVSLYLVGLNFAVLAAEPSSARDASMVNVLSLWLAHAAVVCSVRTGWLSHPIAAPLLYRVATYGGVQLTYFFFAKLLPVANPRALDHQLYNLDLRLFGVEPAVFLDRFVTPTTTEWFAFFYFSYFFVLALHVLPILFLVRNGRIIGEFALGMLLLFCVGHTLYMFVPGYGPYKAMPEVFAHQLSETPWWNITKELVARSGAQKDIFPSLHTAAPTFILLFSFHRRGELPFKYTWPLVGFFACNIVIATMFLRWHYVIDVIAGLLLAVFAHTVSLRLTDRELARREGQNLPPIWPQWPLFRWSR
jgi:hypothetical protein